ncbi:MAG: flagellar biosynthetic protein FliQ [bacterium]
MEEMLLEHMGKGFITMLVISMPCVLAAAAIGLVVGIIQAVTQIQEQTIAAAPKIFILFLLLMVGGGAFTDILKNYFFESAHMAFEVVTKDDDFALGANDSLTPHDGTGGVQKDSLNKLMNQQPKDAYNKQASKVQNRTGSASAPSGPNFAESHYINSKR